MISATQQHFDDDDDGDDDYYVDYDDDDNNDYNNNGSERYRNNKGVPRGKRARRMPQSITLILQKKILFFRKTFVHKRAVHGR